ncbi:hypothetical protein [Nostoc sp.]
MKRDFLLLIRSPVHLTTHHHGGNYQLTHPWSQVYHSCCTSDNLAQS